MQVTITPAAQKQFDALPVVIRIRTQDVLARLENWPSVSGAKPLRGALAGSYRIRTGDYRVLFTPRADRIEIWKIAHRREVYE